MISKKLLGRTDIDEYAYASKDVKNFLPASMGGLFSRPGTVMQKFINERGVVIPWERSEGIYYLVYKQGAYDETPFEAYDQYWVPKNTAFSGAQLVNFATSAPFPTHKQLIEYQTNAGAEFESLDYDGFCFMTIENNIILTHNSGLIPPLVFSLNSGGGVVIEHFQYTGQLSVNTTSGPSYNPFSVALGFLSTPYEIDRSGISMSSSVAVPGGQEGKQTTSHVMTVLTTTGNYFTAEMKWTWVILLQGANEGVYLITNISSSTTADAMVMYYGTDTSSSNRFRVQAYSPLKGFPKVLASFNSRSIFANTMSRPNWFTCSRTNNYREIWGSSLSQASTITEVHSFELPLTTKAYSEIKWISQQNDLLIGTGKEEFVLLQGENALSILNIGISSQSNIGGSFVPAIKNSEACFFVSADGKSIRQIQYNFDVRGYRSKNISILNDDLIYKLRSNQSFPSTADIRIVRIAWQESNRVLWVLTNTGNLFAITIEPASSTMAWSWHIIGMEENIKDIFTFFSDSMKRSILGVVTERSMGYFVDFMAPEYLNDSLTVDSLNIADQPVFMDGSVIIKTIVTPIVFTARFNGPELSFTSGDETDSAIGLGQRIPTGKTYRITNITYPNADGPSTVVTVGQDVYFRNNYGGYGLPSLNIATTAANAIANTVLTPDKSMVLEFTDVTPTTKFNKWGTFSLYIGKQLDVIAEGVLYEGLIVGTDGIITLPNSVTASGIVAGFFFDARWESITPDVAGSFGSATGSMKRAERIYIRYHKSRTGQVGTSETSLEDIAFKGDLPYSGTIEQHPAGTSDREFSFIIVKDKSLPLNIMSVTFRGQVNE